MKWKDPAAEAFGICSLKILSVLVAPQECSSLSEVTFLKQWAVLKGWATGERLTGQTTEVSSNELRVFDLLSWHYLSDSNDKPPGSPNKSSPTSSINPLMSVSPPTIPTSLPSFIPRSTETLPLHCPFTKTVYIYKKCDGASVLDSPRHHTLCARLRIPPKKQPWDTVY